MGVRRSIIVDNTLAPSSKPGFHPCRYAPGGADVLQRGMGLVAIAGAQLGEHGMTDGRRLQTKEFPFDFGADGGGVGSRAGGAKTRRLELYGAILKDEVGDLALNGLYVEGAKVRGAVECCEGI